MLCFQFPYIVSLIFHWIVKNVVGSVFNEHWPKLFTLDRNSNEDMNHDNCILVKEKKMKKERYIIPSRVLFALYQNFNIDIHTLLRKLKKEKKKKKTLMCML